MRKRGGNSTHIKLDKKIIVRGTNKSKECLHSLNGLRKKTRMPYELQLLSNICTRTKYIFCIATAKLVDEKNTHKHKNTQLNENSVDNSLKAYEILVQ